MDFLVQIMPNTHAQISSYKSLFVVLLLCFNTIVNNNNNNNNNINNNKFTTKDSYTWNITHNTESTAVWSLKPERWGSLLVQENYQEGKACDKRRNNNNSVALVRERTIPT